jgi:hypothetical protein
MPAQQPVEDGRERPYVAGIHVLLRRIKKEEGVDGRYKPVQARP